MQTRERDILCHLPLQQFRTALVHRRVDFALRFAEALVARLIDGLAEEALLCIVAQMLCIIVGGQQLEEALHVGHDGGGLLAQLLAIDDVQLLGGVEGEPVLEVLGVFAGIEATVAQVFERFGGRVAGGYYLEDWVTDWV